ncbi:hypothetical protein AVEN_44311-1 [Araneus ventricosus]|uniref:Uncharacterized protein n=1 Tax=Araneus ventricosus TaxID=182803 RepID=A0A4Y2DPI1_ARAVE|nr:hypothetical protein AVEN_44311-1 [Araneus ventricosus]
MAFADNEVDCYRGEDDFSVAAILLDNKMTIPACSETTFPVRSVFYRDQPGDNLVTCIKAACYRGEDDSSLLLFSWTIK